MQTPVATVTLMRADYAHTLVFLPKALSLGTPSSQAYLASGKFPQMDAIATDLGWFIEKKKKTALTASISTSLGCLAPARLAGNSMRNRFPVMARICILPEVP